MALFFSVSTVFSWQICLLVYLSEPQKKCLISSHWCRSFLIICIYFVDVRDIDEEEWQYLGPPNSAVS